MFENQTRLWVVHMSKGRQQAERAQREGFICIGWTRIGDLAPHDTPEKMKDAMKAAFPSKSAGSINATYMQVYRFAHEMQVGDPVVYPVKGGRDVFVGKIVGPYEWSSDRELQENDYANVRRVEWIKQVPRIAFSTAALNSFGSFTSVSTADDHLAEVRGVLRGEQTAPTADDTAPASADNDDTDADDATTDVESTTQETKDYLLKRWSRTHQDFEEVVAAVFRALGYTAHVQQGTHDLGVDVIAHHDPLGVTPPTLKIQAKSGTYTCGAPAVKQLRGTLNAGEKGVLVSLGGFSNDARHTEQNDANLILIDADRFTDLFLGCYEKLSPEMRHRFPLQQVYVVAT